MARQVITSFTDDLDGSEASGTVAFALNGREYEIDLSSDNAQKLKAVLEPFVTAARRAGGRVRARRGLDMPSVVRRSA